MAESERRKRESDQALASGAVGRDRTIPRFLSGQEDYDQQLARILAWDPTITSGGPRDRDATFVAGVDPFV